MGFTGRYLTAELRRRNESVVVFDSAEGTTAPLPGIQLIRGNIRRREDLAKIRLCDQDVVYHLAARVFHSGAPRLNRNRWFREVNVEGTRILLEAMKESGARKLVFFSTDMVYGLPAETPVPTTHE